MPTTGSGNNGNVMGYWYNDSVNTFFSHTASYTYDNVNRLTQATATGNSTYTQLYSYTQGDGSNGQYGNMTCTAGCTPANWTLDPGNNHLTPSASYTYDAAGNLTTDGSTGHTYQWDAEGRVKSVDNGATWGFTYNALGHRVQWTYSNGAGANQHMFDPNGGWLGIYGALDVFRRGDGAYAWYTGTEMYFNHVNNIGTTAMLTNHFGTEVYDLVYYPWGQMPPWLSSGGGGANYAELPYQNVNTNTNIAMYRFHPPGLGRWLSPDPVAGGITNPQSLNRYAYVLNNPCSMVDPLGLGYCNFNVRFINDRGFTNAQVTAAEQQVNSLLGSVASPNGDTVGISWVSGGGAGATLTATNQSWLSSLFYGPAMGIYSWWPPLSPRVWVNNLPAYSSPALIGSAGLHELAHYWLGDEQAYDPSNLNTLMFDNLPLSMQTGALLNPNSSIWKLSPKEISKMYSRCLKTPRIDNPRGGYHGNWTMYLYWYDFSDLDLINPEEGTQTNDDTGPGSGWCPACPPPTLTPR